MYKIKQVSRFFRVLFQIYLIAAPLFLAYGWIHAPHGFNTPFGPMDFSNIPQSYAHNIFHKLTSTEKFLGFIISLVPMGISLFVTYTLIKLFKLYEKGEIFSLTNVNYIRHVGYGLLASQLINPIYEPLLGLILTYKNRPEHSAFMQITLSQTSCIIMLMAFLVILISWIMIEGCRLREEQQLTI